MQRSNEPVGLRPPLAGLFAFQRQLDRSAALGGLVDREDDLDALASFPAIDQRRGSCLHSPDEILELLVMSAIRNRFRIAGAPSAADPPGKLFANGGVLARAWLELPQQNVILLDDH